MCVYVYVYVSVCVCVNIECTVLVVVCFRFTDGTSFMELSLFSITQELSFILAVFPSYSS